MPKKKSFQISDTLTQGLENTISAAHNYAGSLNIEIIPLNKIELDPNNPRELILSLIDVKEGISKEDPDYEKKLIEQKHLQSLAHSIEEQGIINPILVYRFQNKYRLVAGERRTLASFIANKKDIQAKILDKLPSPLKLSLLQWVENIERKDLSLWERLHNLEIILENYAYEHKKEMKDITATDIKNLIGCKKSQGKNYRAVIQAPTTIKEHIKNNDIKSLEKAAVLSRLTSQTLRKKALELCIDGTSLKNLKNFVEEKTILKEEKIEQKEKVKEFHGRRTRINLGHTLKIEIVRIIIDSVIKQTEFDQINKDLYPKDWHNYQDVELTFKKLIHLLEKNISNEEV